MSSLFGLSSIFGLSQFCGSCLFLMLSSFLSNLHFSGHLSLLGAFYFWYLLDFKVAKGLLVPSDLV